MYEQCAFSLYSLFRTLPYRGRRVDLVSAHDWSPNTHGFHSSCTFFLAAWELNKIIGYAQFLMHKDFP